MGPGGRIGNIGKVQVSFVSLIALLLTAFQIVFSNTGKKYL